MRKKIVVIVLAAALTAASPPALAEAGNTCSGKCWEIDQEVRTITWTGPTDGTEDIWQADEYLSLVREGYEVRFQTSVPGELEICVGIVQVNGDTITWEGCQSDLQVPAGQFSVSTTGTSGGFRWKPAEGYGWRASAQPPPDEPSGEPGSAESSYPWWISFLAGAVIAFSICTLVLIAWTNIRALAHRRKEPDKELESKEAAA